jgi:tRNA pseudouridine38-40 synthase
MEPQSSHLHRYALRLAYHGADFLGWQRQPEGRTVQGVLETALAQWLRADVAVVGVGRTDTGVHARNYVAHLEVPKAVDCAELVFRMNRFLPDDLVLFEAVSVADDVHARFSAVARGYAYRIHRSKSAFGRDTAWLYERNLNESLLHEMAASIHGEHHFGAFERSGGAATNGLCRIHQAEWVASEGVLEFRVVGNRFLRNMVRSLVGTMVEQAVADRGLAEWNRILSSQKRTESGPSAPAHGLTFAGAHFAAPLFDGRENPQFI